MLAKFILYRFMLYRLIKAFALFSLVTLTSACDQDKSSVSSEAERVDKEIEKTPKNTATASDNITSEVLSAVEQAKQQGDFRLFHSTGRRTTVQGFEQMDSAQLQEQCGLKRLEYSGDVVKNKEQRALQKQQYVFAKQYNQLMYPYCQQHLSK